MPASKTINPTAWNWPVPVEPAGVTLTGYLVGIRDLNAAGSAAGTYPITVPVTDPAAATEPVSAAMAMLKSPGDYQSAIQSVTSVGNGPWTAETTAAEPGTGSDFSLVPPAPPTPVSPSTFTVG